MAAFNRRDPRFQRAIQAEAARGFARGNRPRTKQITAEHAGYQLGRQIGFERLSIASKLAEMQHEMAMSRAQDRSRRIGLGEKRLSFDVHKQTRRLRDAKKAERFAIISGLGGAGLSFMEGRRRKKLLSEERSDRKEFMELLRKRQSNARFDAIDEPIYDPYALQMMGLGGR